MVFICFDHLIGESFVRLVAAFIIIRLIYIIDISMFIYWNPVYSDILQCRYGGLSSLMVENRVISSNVGVGVLSCIAFFS